MRVKWRLNFVLLLFVPLYLMENKSRNGKETNNAKSNSTKTEKNATNRCDLIHKWA